MALAVEYVPGPQSTQTLLPTALCHVPGLHRVQLRACAVRNLPAVQSRQAEKPEPVRYVPGEHARHAVLEAPGE
jgi:hypothetical protein